MLTKRIFLGVILVAASTVQVALADDGQTRVTGQANSTDWTLQLELDPTQTTSNALQKPNRSIGTRFDVVDYAGKDSTLGRLSVARAVDWGREGSEVRLEVVPFQQSGTRIAKSTIRFDGVTFEAGLPLTVLYQFNTYRFTYDLPVFRELDPERWLFRIGGTLALRDAQARLTEPRARANYVNYGPVPLLYALSALQLSDAWRIEADVDAFPAPGGGGLLDISGRTVWSVSARASVFVGIRYEAGGAAQDTIYTYFHQRSALAGVRFAF